MIIKLSFMNRIFSIIAALSCFVWGICVPLAFCLSRFTGIGIIPLYAICQGTDLIKCALGSVMLKQGKWIQNLTA